MGFLDKLFPVKQTKTRILESDEKAIAENGTEKQRQALAQDEHTSQDVLFYLAGADTSKSVRRAVAENPSTPMQASPLLARDPEEDVRLVLARRLVKILPDLSQDKYSQLYAYAVQSLGMLALDEVLKVRKALAETLKDHAHTPPAIAAQLARDLEREVSEPILRFCVALSDDDLVDILKTHPANWAAEAVADRKQISSRVSRAVIDTGNVRAGKILLSNEGAVLDENLYEMIVERAREYPEWHKPLATRKTLPPRMAMKLAAYVDKTIARLLTERTDIDSATIDDVKGVVQRRVEYEDSREKTVIDRTNPVERAQKLHAADDITDEVLSDALAMQDHEFVIACLALRAGTKMDDIRKVFDVRAPRTICALTWRAGFSMRLALKLQQTLGRVPHTALIYPRGGTDYPLTEEEMRWQLDAIGIK